MSNLTSHPVISRAKGILRKSHKTPQLGKAKARIIMQRGELRWEDQQPDIHTRERPQEGERSKNDTPYSSFTTFLFCPPARYIAVHYPLNYSQTANDNTALRRRMLKYLLPVATLSAAFNVTKFLEATYDYGN